MDCPDINTLHPGSVRLMTALVTLTESTAWTGGDCFTSLQWRHNDRDGFWNHQRLDCLLNKKSKLRVTGLCEGNSPVTGEFPAQRTSNAVFFHLMMSSCGWARSQLMREDITYVTSRRIGWDFALISTAYPKFDQCVIAMYIQHPWLLCCSRNNLSIFTFCIRANESFFQWKLQR